MRAFIIHRWGGNPNSDWYPWLKNELEKRKYKVEVSEMPNTSEPKIESWVQHLNKVVGKLDSDTLFIAHSIGCQTVMRFLEKSSYNGKLMKVIFVAGWFKLNNLEDDKVKGIADPWVSKMIDFNKVKDKISKLTVFLSSNDPYGFVEHNAKVFKEKLGARVMIFKNKGHFSEDDGITTLPELLREI